jgi:hypothetical protein
VSAQAAAASGLYSGPNAAYGSPLLGCGVAPDRRSTGVFTREGGTLALGRRGLLSGRSRCSVLVVTDATITCPCCGTSRRETMPENACQYFYRCTGCGEKLKPEPGDCCVFCSYADAQCPARQVAERAS